MTPRKKLLVYAEQDTATGIWLIDCPQLFIIGAQASGSLADAIDEVIMPDPKTQLEVRDMTGEYQLDYDGVEVA